MKGDKIVLQLPIDQLVSLAKQDFLDEGRKNGPYLMKRKAILQILRDVRDRREDMEITDGGVFMCDGCINLTGGVDG